MMTMLPQILLSGLFFPLYSMPWGVRWIGYCLPLTWFVKIARGVMVRGTPIDALWLPLVVLAVMAAIVFTLSVLRFRRDLAPAGRTSRRRRRRRRATERRRDALRRRQRREAVTWGVEDLTVRFGQRTALDGVASRCGAAP